MIRRLIWTGLALVLAALPAIAAPRPQLEVRETRYGFDGAMTPHRINPVSILLDNTGDAEFDGEIILQKAALMGGELDAPLAQKSYLAPGTSRWVQFHVYPQRAEDMWILKFGGSGASVTLPAARMGPPATVLLEESDSFLAAKAVKAMPESLFPLSVSATDGLRAVFLDHVPRWEPLRREAFVEWVKRGGELHILQGINGRWPEFSGELEPLSAEGRVGAGTVVRHAVTRGELAEAFLKTNGYPPPELHDDSVQYRGTDEIFRRLSKMTRPEYNWVLIYLLILLYIVMAGPVNYLLGRKWRDWRKTGAFFLCSVMLFGGGIGAIGRRGYGETARVNSISYARPVGSGAWDVTTWCNVFALDGDYYSFLYDCPYSIYSTCQDFEAVKGMIRNGREGIFMADIPGYSSRAFLHRGRFNAADGIEPAVVIDRDVTVRFNGKLLDDIETAWVITNGVVTELQLNGNKLMPRRTPAAADAFLSKDEGHEWSEVNEGIEASRLEMARTIIGTALNHEEFRSINAGEMIASPDRSDLFILAETPENMKLKSSRDVGGEKGYTIFHWTFFTSEPENGNAGNN